MAYFKIKNNTTNEFVDVSIYVNKLNIQTNHVYSARTNASGNTSVKLINSKKVITVGIIALDEAITAELVKLFNQFQMTVEFRDPETKELKTANCILPKNSIEYYTIQADTVKTKAYTLTFEEL